MYDARTVAERFLAWALNRQYQHQIQGVAFLPVRVGPCSSLFWWDDDTPLFEFPFLLSNGKPTGYVIVSGLPTLPPIFEYTLDGDAVSTTLTRYVTDHFLFRGQYIRSVRWYYWSPLEYVAAIDFYQEDEPLFVSIPELRRAQIPSTHRIRRDPNQYWDPGAVQSRWDAVGTISTPSPKGIGKTLPHLKPVSFNQNCRQTVLTFRAEDTGHYCDPKCIVGCTPVGWAMFASSRKRVDQGGGGSSIWSGSTCWDKEWPSYADSDHDPSQCSDVSSTIWEMHDLMETSCDGWTYDDKWHKAQEYFSTKWGLNWHWGQQEDVLFDKCNGLINNDHTFVFGARGEWSAYITLHFPELLTLFDTTGKAGHTVVCWGSAPADWAVGDMIFVCFGWGKDFSENGSKWIEFDGFRDNKIAYISRFA